MPADRERALDSLARGRYGLATRSELRTLGFSASEIDRRLASGRLIPCHEGVYRLAGVPESYRGSLCAAVLAGGPAAAASHRAACVLWDIHAAGVYGESEEPPVELTVVHRRHPQLERVIVHRSVDLVPAHVTVRSGIPVTNPLRLLVDLGAVLPGFLVERALDELLIQRRVTVTAVRAMLGRVARRGRSGCGVLREILDSRALGDAIPDGMLEPVMAALCRDHGVPPLVFQHSVRLGVRSVRIDFAHLPTRVAIEVDGWAFHGTREAFQADRARANELTAAGWVVLRFTWDDVVGRPWSVAATIKRVIAERGVRWLGRGLPSKGRAACACRACRSGRGASR